MHNYHKGIYAKFCKWERLVVNYPNFFMAGFTLFATVDVMLFGGAIAFLMAPATAQYFKAQSHKGTHRGEQRS